MALPSFFAPGAFFRFDKSVHFSYDVIYCIRRRDAIKAATQQRMAQMKDKMARRDAWETGKGGSKPGYFHALRVNWERMGYPAWLYFGAIATAAVVMIMPVVLLVAFADRLGSGGPFCCCSIWRPWSLSTQRSSIPGRWPACASSWGTRPSSWSIRRRKRRSSSAGSVKSADRSGECGAE